MSSPTVVLVHGAWHGSWCWANIVEDLESADIAVVAVDLPGHDSPGSSRRLWKSFGSYVAHVGDVVDGIDGDVVLIGHSMGGLVTPITEVECGHDIMLESRWPELAQPIREKVASLSGAN